jgi:hypothetical protein
MHAITVVYCSMEIMQTLTSAPSVAMIGTRGKRMVEMIRDKKKKANEGLL